MIVLETPKESTEDVESSEPDRIPLFSIDGVQYTMPAEIKPYAGIRYLWMLRTHSNEEAAAWLMEYVLGADGFEALASYEPLTMPQYTRIADIIRDHTMGALEGQGKALYSGNGQKKSRGS